MLQAKRSSAWCLIGFVAGTCQVLNGRYIRMADSDGRPAYTREDEHVKLTYSNT